MKSLLARHATTLALTFFSGAAFAQMPAPLDPATLDIAGVKLGMTLDQATAALQAFDPKYTIFKLYSFGPGNFDNLGGQHASEFNNAVIDQARSFAISAELGTANALCVDPHSDDCKTFGDAPNVATYKGESDAITVTFTPALTDERVIAIQRETDFPSGQPAAIQSLKAGIFAKYPKASVTCDEPSREFLGQNEFGNPQYKPTYILNWLFDSRNRILSKTSAEDKGYGCFGGLPGAVRPGDGVSLRIAFDVGDQNSGLTPKMKMILYSGDALYKSVQQAQDTWNAIKAQQQAKALQNATQNQPATKF